jgi:SAM-dependent methyltransferase
MAVMLDAEGWDRRYADRELLWSAEANRFVVEETGHLPPGRALDLATGEGRNAVWLAERGWQVTAVDFSRVGLAKAEQLAGRRGVKVRWVQADLATWEPPSGAFDLVLVAYLHVPRDVLEMVLRRSVASVAPAGRLVVVGHDRENLERGHGGPSEPSVLYSVQELTALLDPLTVERAEQVHRPVELDDGTTATAIDALVRAVRPV